MQTSDLSWWPKHATFMSSGLWCGYWSHNCEEWYQNRHRAIMEHRAELKSATAWKTSMKPQRTVGKLREANMSAASQYLDSATAAVLY